MTLATFLEFLYLNANRFNGPLPRSLTKRLTVYDVQERLVEVLVEAHQPAGWHQVYFEADGLASGVYFYRLEAGDSQDVRQLLVLR